ncbi:MAG: hypothetical protein O3A21_04350 [Proteobacteria bacterium]|nr:hypothetical protein [Pseudomonadota bacterium]
MHDDTNEEPREVRHEAWPGYPRIFAVVFAVCLIWLVILLIWGAAPGH